MSMQFQVFVGYDPRQPIAANVVMHSLMRHASKPVPVTRLQLNQLPMTRRGLTEFTYSRFLVPYLSGFDGYSLFLDADILVRADITKILDGVDPSAAVSVVLHEGKLAFERASVMLFNNKRCRMLTPEYVDNPQTAVMSLNWAQRVGSLHKDWNQLVDYLPPNPSAKIVHYTKGIPCWPETDHCEWAKAWHDEVASMNHTVPFAELMAGSVHGTVKNRIELPHDPTSSVIMQNGQVVGPPNVAWDSTKGHYVEPVGANLTSLK